MRVYMRKEDRQRLIKESGVCASTVSMALSFKSNSLLSRKLRLRAMNNYRGFFISK